MSPSRQHEQIKKQERGTTGKTEVPRVHKGHVIRLDVMKKNKAVEVQTTVTSEGLRKSAERLKASGKKQKVLVVPKAEDVPKAARALREAKISGTARTPDKKAKAHVSHPKRKPSWPWW